MARNEKHGHMATYLVAISLRLFGEE